MKAFVIYESLYGNTAAIGTAIAASLRAHGLEVESAPISTVWAAELPEVDLLVLGGPTHAHGMSRASTRRTADQDAKNTFADRTVEPGVREWLEELPHGNGRLAAAFDTRIDKALLLTGSAARGIARRLERKGYRLVLDPECFLVTTKNALVAAETEHAARWGAELAAAASAPAGRS